MSIRDSSRVKRYVQLWEEHGNSEKKFSETVENKSANLSIGKINFHAEYIVHGEVIEFVPAFIDRYRQGENIKRSVSVMPEWSDWDEDDADSLSLEPEEELETKDIKIYKPLGPVGYKFKTDVLRFDFPREILDEKFGYTDLTIQEDIIKNYVGFLYTFQATHALAIVTELEVELEDLGYTWEISDESVISYIYDVFEGGSGITKNIYFDWIGDKHIIKNKIRRILYPPENEFCCHHRCEKCILLPRTPEFLLSADLLDKDYVRVLFE